jgi:16S rRNA (cytidine1402-2'-O)-methyltransferase
MSGIKGLTLVGLPIGNYQDITLRALEILKDGKYFYAEDTRVFKSLLEHYEINYANKFIDSFHDHSENKVEAIIGLMKNGNEVYLVSDAGSPIISDPAYPLVKRVHEENLSINTIPGITSVITALELSGLPPHPFHFWGFIARTKGEKATSFTTLAAIKGTHLFFESPHRIYETINIFFEINPEGALVIARELTKKFETVMRITKADLPKIKELVLDKGEFVILFHNDNVSESSINLEMKELVNDFLDNGGGTKKLAKIFSKILGEDSKLIYNKLKES